MAEKSLSWKELYQLSEFPYQEMFLDSTLQQMGASQSRYLERLGRAKKGVKPPTSIISVMMSIYTAVLMTFPIEAFLNMRGELATGQGFEWMLFAGSLSIGLFFLVSLAYMFLFGLMRSSVLISGDAFKFLTTLPISEKDMQKVVMFTFFRNMQVQVAAVLIVFPVGIAIVTANAVLVLISIGITVVSLLFSFSILILVGERVNRVLRGNDVNTTKASLIRIATLLGIGLGFFIILLAFRFAMQGINSLFTPPNLNSQSLEFINIVASLIPFPFAGNYLLAETFIGGQVIPWQLWVSSVIGMAVFIIVTVYLFRKVLATLRHVIYFEPKKFSTNASRNAKAVSIEAVTPVKAFLKKDVSVATRDSQTLMYLIFPFTLPVMGLLLSLIPVTSSAGSDLTTTGFRFLFSMGGALMVLIGIVNTETMGASALASLPVVVRDQVLAKLLIIMIIMPISALFSFVLYANSTNSELNLALLVITLPLGIIFGLIAIEVKVRLFGKLRYQYVLEEINGEKKIQKWIAIILSDLGLLCVILISALLLNSNLSYATMLCLLEEAGATAILVVLFNRMFPKINDAPTVI